MEEIKECVHSNKEMCQRFEKQNSEQTAKITSLIVVTGTGVNCFLGSGLMSQYSLQIFCNFQVFGTVYYDPPLSVFLGEQYTLVLLEDTFQKLMGGTCLWPFIFSTGRL